MPTIITHAVIAAAAGKAFARKPATARICKLAALCSILPDLDVLAFRLGIAYRHVLGHRGVWHSPFFALLLALAATFLARRKCPRSAGRWWATLAFFFAVAASHGVLDAMTDGGLGVAFLAPFSDARYFLPFRPLAVSPIGIRGLFSSGGLRVLASEILWVWIPAGAALLAYLLARKRHSRSLDPGAPGGGQAKRPGPGA